jgi:hypothetical protein
MGFFDGFYSLKILMLVCFVFRPLFFYCLNDSFQWVWKIKKLNVGVLFFLYLFWFIYIGVTYLCCCNNRSDLALVACFRGANWWRFIQKSGCAGMDGLRWVILLLYKYFKVSIWRGRLFCFIIQYLFSCNFHYTFFNSKTGVQTPLKLFIILSPSGWNKR